MPTYRILSLDGGGSWAIIHVKALIRIYSASTTGHEVLSTFDLAAANSGGSIVLGCLLADFTLGEIYDFFNSQVERQTIFSKTHSVEDALLRTLLGSGPKYSAAAKLPAIRQVLKQTGDMTLADAVRGIRRTGSSNDLHALIVGFNYDRNRATFFRSEPVSSPSWGTGDTTNVTLAEAIHASSNAPVNYFDAPTEFPGHSGRYWDGAISGCNNPVHAAVTEAIGIGQDPLNLAALSLGTASVALPYTDPAQPPFTQPLSPTGFPHDLAKLAGAIVDDPPDFATFLAHVLTASGAGLTPPQPNSRIVRMNPLISPVPGPDGNFIAPGSISADDFQALANLDMDAILQPQVDSITAYADLWLNDQAPNQPIRMDSTTLTPELGQSTFSAALAAWESIR